MPKGYRPKKTKYEGVYAIESTNRATKKTDTIYYISFYRGGKRIYEKAGDKSIDKMNALRASQLRTAKIEGRALPNVEVRKAEKAARAAEEAAKEAEANRWTFNRLWEAWKADRENQGKRGTVKADQRYRKHIQGPFGNREPSNLGPLDIDRLRLSLAEGHSRETTKSVISLIRRIERYGASKRLCAGLSFPIILRGKKLGKDPRAKRAPTDIQVDAYIKACEAWPDPQAGAFQLFIAFTGIRRGSARNLKWEDVDLEHHTAVLKDSKTGDVQIVLGDDAVELLRKHPKTTDDEGEVIPYVFTGADPDGRRSQRQIDRIPAKIRDAAGLPADLDPCHSFRRRLATKIEAAHGIATAMKYGGWKSPAMVINYTATSKAILRDAANLLGRAKANGEQNGTA